jgi:hypothetical protein
VPNGTFQTRFDALFLSFAVDLFHKAEHGDVQVPCSATETKAICMNLFSTKCSATTLVLAVAFLIPSIGLAQVNTGSDGSNGVFNPTVNTNINMADHPTGIYQYISVNIPNGVTVTFTPNANNTPLTWLVKGACVISGTVNVSGQDANGITSGAGGPGGGAGGYGGQGASVLAHRGAGLGGGDPGQYNVGVCGGGGSYAATGSSGNEGAKPGLVYGNKFLLPILGGSGGGGGFYSSGGGGGGGAILIASDTSIRIDGSVNANGGGGSAYGGSGSGGGIRVVAPQIAGHGAIQTGGGGMPQSSGSGGNGFVRLDVLDDQFVGWLSDSASRGFNPILTAPVQSVTLAIQSIAGNVVSQNPTGVLYTPDATISGQQTTPIPIVVSCVNLPLNTPITVVVKPVNGPTVLGSTVNNTGTLSSSTATVSITIPRGGGLVYATATTSK